MVERIDFSALQTPDYAGNALKYYRAGQQQSGAERGGTALGAGDYAGAAQAYGRAGMGDEALNALKLGEVGAETRRKADLAAQQQKGKALLQVVQGLQNVPEGQRKVALQAAYPLLHAAQIDTSQFDQLGEDQLTTPALQAFGGEVQSHLEVVNRGEGGYDVVDKRTGQNVRSVPQTPKPDRPLVVGNGATVIDPATGQPVFRSPKTFAPPHPKAPGEPSILVPPAPWTRKW